MGAGEVDELVEGLPEGNLEETREEGLGVLPSEDRDAVGRYFAEMGKYPTLSPEEEVDLARKVWRGQEAAKALAELLSLEEASILAAARGRLLEQDPSSPSLLPPKPLPRRWRRGCGPRGRRGGSTRPSGRGRRPARPWSSPTSAWW